MKIKMKTTSTSSQWTSGLLCFGLLSMWTSGVSAQQQEQQALNKAKNLWESLTQSFPQTYYYEYRLMSTLTGDGSLGDHNFIRVEDNAVTSADSFMMMGTDNNNIANYPTVSTMFDTIQLAINDWSAGSGDVTSVSVVYDPTLGYPTNTTMVFSNGVVNQTDMNGLTYYALEQQDLNNARALWESYGLDNGMYQYTVQYSCYCMQEFVEPKNIVVKNNQVVSAKFVSTGEAYSSPTEYETVSQLFDQIQTYIDNLDAFISIDYDPTYGYPTLINETPDYQLADAGQYIQASNLKVLSSSSSSGTTGNGSSTPAPSGSGGTEGTQSPTNDSNVVTTNPTTTTTTYDKQVTQDDLDTHKALWESFSMQEYYYAFQHSCFCMENYTQVMVGTVQDGVVTSAYYMESGLSVPSDVLANGIWSVEQLFGTIQDGLDQNAYAINVTYDATYGYPTMIWIDYDQMMADEEFNTFITYLAPKSIWQNDLNTARSTWQSTGESSYTYVYQDRLGRKTVEVVNGEIASVQILDSHRDRALAAEAPTTTAPNTDTGTGTGVADGTALTIDDLLDLIQQGIDQNPYQVNVEYNDQYGYPTNIFIDYDVQIADEELDITVTDLTFTTSSSTTGTQSNTVAMGSATTAPTVSDISKTNPEDTINNNNNNNNNNNSSPTSSPVNIIPNPPGATTVDGSGAAKLLFTFGMAYIGIGVLLL